MEKYKHQQSRTQLALEMTDNWSAHARKLFQLFHGGTQTVSLQQGFLTVIFELENNQL